MKPFQFNNKKVSRPLATKDNFQVIRRHFFSRRILFTDKKVILLPLTLKKINNSNQHYIQSKRSLLIEERVNFTKELAATREKQTI